MSSIESSIRWSTVGSLSKSVIQLLQVFILTKFLTPDDYGLVAICMLFIGLSGSVIDIGISTSIIYEKNLTNLQLSSLLWISSFLGFFAFLILFFGSIPIAIFYEERELTQMIQLICAPLILLGVSTHGLTLLKKDLNFKKIAAIDVLSSIGSITCALILAVNGWGAWSLIWAHVTANLIKVVLIWALSPLTLSMFRSFSYSSVRPQIMFGINTFGQNLLTWFRKEFDILIIGKILGMEALGIYNISKLLYSKSTFFLGGIIKNIQGPHIMSKSSIKDKVDVSLSTSKIFMAFSLAAFFAIAINRESIIQTVLDPKWSDTSFLILILLPSWIFRTIRVSYGPIFISVGNARLSFHYTLAITIFSCIVLSASIIGFGIYGIAIGLLVSEAFANLIFFYLAASHFFVDRNLKKEVINVVKYCRTFLGYVVAVILSLLASEIPFSHNGVLFLGATVALGFLWQLWFLRQKYPKTFASIATLLGLSRIRSSISSK